MLENAFRVLLRRAFAGYFAERRLVDEATSSYKDVVRLYPEETELANDLRYAAEVSLIHNKSVFGSYTNNPPSIWVQPMDVPLGKHWFIISSVDLTTEGLSYSMKSLRHFPGEEIPSTNASPNDVQPITLEHVQEFFQNGYTYVKQNLNLRGLINIIKFIAILIMTLFTGLFKLVFFTGDFSIKIMKELNVFIDVSTPMFLGLLEFVTKVVGGFYILCAMIFRNCFLKNGQPSGTNKSGSVVPYRAMRQR